MTARTPWWLALVVVLAAVAAAPATAQVPIGTDPSTEVAPALEADMPFRVFVTERRARRERAHAIFSRKCQAHTGAHFRLLSWEVPGWRRAENLAYWRQRVLAAIAKRNVCMSMSYAHHTSLWLCIHSREGAWNDPNPPYFGGLQMGYWFMETYGGELYRTKGTADHWTAAEQMAVADRAYHAGGHSRSWLFGQWPLTAPPCA
jgi:hypothetical protein